MVGYALEYAVTTKLLEIERNEHEMIVDEILDRKDYEEEGYDIYNAHDFYMYCMKAGTHFRGIANKITYAMDYLENKDVQEALCEYIINNNYNSEICNYIRRKDWLTNGKDKKEFVNGGYMLVKCS